MSGLRERIGIVVVCRVIAGRMGLGDGPGKR